jgi:hypothetical protein
MQTIDCPQCIARARGFVVPVDQDAEYAEHCRQWRKAHREESHPDYVLARGTTVRLVPEQWRRKVADHKRPAVWKRDHVIRVGVREDWNTPSRTHITVSNSSHKRDQENVRLCNAPQGMIGFDGPGADQHIAEDAQRVALVLDREDKAARDLARRKLLNSEADALSRQLEAALKALGFESANATTGWKIPSGRRDDVISPEAYRVSLRLPDVVRLVEALGSSVFRPNPLPPPLWKVWYGATKNEDKKPLYLAARNRAAVVAHMTAHYCHDPGDDDRPKVALKPELLIIEEAGPDPEVPEAEDKAKAS